MKFFQRLSQTVWAIIAKIILPHKAFQLDNLDVSYEEMQKELAQLKQRQQQRAPLKATWIREGEQPITTQPLEK